MVVKVKKIPGEIKENISLKNFNNLKIGGKARYFVEVENLRKTKKIIKWAMSNHIPFFILGGGTNVLIDDEGFDGLVIRIKINFLKRRGELVEVGAGVLVSDFLDYLTKQGLSGLEWAGGLPGTVGGAIRGNAGCFGGEIKDVIVSVESFNTLEFKTKKRDTKECCFSYRSSIFKELGSREIILKAVMKFTPGISQKIREFVQEKINYRLAHHPLDYPNLGSFFKNVDFEKIPRCWQKQFLPFAKNDPFLVVPAACLISEVGLKGFQWGGATISSKHPNFIVNVGKAKFKDFEEIIKIVKKKVKEKFKVELEEEIVRLRNF